LPVSFSVQIIYRIVLYKYSLYLSSTHEGMARLSWSYQTAVVTYAIYTVK